MVALTISDDDSQQSNLCVYGHHGVIGSIVCRPRNIIVSHFVRRAGAVFILVSVGLLSHFLRAFVGSDYDE